jgi:glycosyltransferase involved in cell wall biosynthesis
LSVVLPAFNEAAGVAETLAQLVQAVPGAEIILVDDHSSDGTGSSARSVAGVKVIRHRYNRDQGAALKTGMRHATREYVAWFDSDNEHRTDDLLKIYDRIRSQDLVAVMGQRTNGSATLTRGLGKWLIRLIGQTMKINAGSDLNCGLRVFQRETVLRYIGLIPDRFSSSLVTTLVMLERRYPIAFEPIMTNPRIGHSTVRMKDGFEAILQLVRAVLLFSPMRFFLPVGAICLGIGVIYSFAIALVAGMGIPVGGLFLMLLGILVFLFGLLADQISQFRLGQFNGLGDHEFLDADLDGDKP